MRRFINRVSLVTGGSSGIGLGITNRFAQEGGKVIVASVDKNISQTIESLKA